MHPAVLPYTRRYSLRPALTSYQSETYIVLNLTDGGM